MHHRTLIFLLAALSMMGALSIDAYLPALPSIARDLAVTPAAAQQTLTVYLFGFAFMMLFYGTLSDSWGRRPVILASLVCYLFSSLGAAVAPSLGWLLFCRILQGLSAGAGQVVGRAMVGDLLSGAEARRAMAYISVVFGLAPALAPVIGGWLLAGFGWHSIFIFIALFTLILLALCVRFLPESLAREQRHPLEFKLIVRRYWEVGCHARFMLQALGYALTFSGVLIYIGSAPAFVFNILHLSAKEFAWLFVPLIGGMTLGSMVSGRLSHRLEAGQMIRVGFITMAVAALTNLLYTALFTVQIPWAVMPLFLYGLGMSLVMPAMSVTNLEMFPHARGLAASLQGFLFMVCFAIGSGVVCPFLFGSAFRLALGVVVGLMLSLVCWYVGRRIPSATASVLPSFASN